MKFKDGFLKTSVFCWAFPKIYGFPGTHGTRSKGAPEITPILPQKRQFVLLFIDEYLDYTIFLLTDIEITVP